jgi:hypothetical protein
MLSLGAAPNSKAVFKAHLMAKLKTLVLIS